MAAKQILRQISMNSDKKIVSTFIMWRNVSTWQILLHISPHDMIFLFIYHVETYLQLNICHVETLLHMTICHMEKFLHMTDIFSTSTAGGAGDKYQVWSSGKYWF